MKHHVNIPVFIPHRGCPQACIFCDQHLISGCMGGEAPDTLVREAEQTIEQALTTLAPERIIAEIAYFGGSFTGIAPDLMESLLALAQRYVDAGGVVRAIRCSTRPDYVGDKVLDTLSRYTVQTVELGVQSLDDGVLAAVKRGHTAAQALDAIARLRARGFTVVGQMMLGLPGADAEVERETARRLCAAGVRGVRIYPTLVLRGTVLAEFYTAGKYQPLSLSEAVERTADLLEIFGAAGVEVIRVGLQETDGLRDGSVLAGPRHSAFGELAMSECFYRRIAAAFADYPPGDSAVTLAVPRGCISAAVGQKKGNISRVYANFGRKIRKVIELDTLFGYNIQIER